VDTSGRHPRLDEVELLAATDVTAPLLGPIGATRLFGPQKGADAATVAELEEALAHFAVVVGPEFARVPGAGAAGGFGFGLAVLAGGGVISGYGLVSQSLQLERRLAASDVVLTGEGRFDRQTSFGKGPGALARAARELGKYVVLFAGSVLHEEGLDPALFDEVIDVSATARPGATPAEALREAVAHWATTTLAMSVPWSTLGNSGATLGRRGR
jgi:glycerate kinase